MDNPPVIDVDGPVIAHALHTFQPPAEEAQEEDDGGGRRRRGGRRWGNGDHPELQAVESAHKDRAGWIPILAWSHGASSSGGRHSRRGGNMQDLSMTKWSDSASPQMTVMCMTNEVLPHGILRVMYTPDEGKFKVIEFVMKNVQISSISTGGSGGEDRLTENITVTFTHVFMRHILIHIEEGKFLEDSKGTYDVESKKGDRDGVFNVPTLKTICKKAVTENVDLFDSRALQRLPRQILEELELSHISAQAKMPLKGRRFLFTTDEIVDGKRTRYREVFVKKLTLDAIKEAAAAEAGFQSSAAKGIFAVTDRSLLQLVKAEQIEDLGENSELFISLV